MDYDRITRSDLEALRRDLRVVGDGNSIAVENGPGGQVVRSLMSIGAPEKIDAPIFRSTYDAVADTYTVSWDSFYVLANWYGGYGGNSNKLDLCQYAVPAGAFTWTAAVLASSIKIHVQPYLEVTSGTDLTQCVVKLKWFNTTVSPYDTDTTESEADGLIGTTIARIAGSGTGAKSPLVIEFPDDEVPVANFGYCYDTETTRFTMPIHGGIPTSTSNQPTYWNKVLGNSFNNSLILGWTQATNSFALDSLANAASYQSYVIVGSAKTDSAGILKIGTNWSDRLRRTFGGAGAISYTKPGGATGTITVVDGLITQWT